MVEKKCDNCDNSLILEPNGPCETCDDDRCNWKPIGTDAVPDDTAPDPINHPSYYADNCSLECADVMLITFGIEGVNYFYLCNAFKYMWRYKHKNGVEDLKKAQWYLDHSKAEYLQVGVDEQYEHMKDLLADLKKKEGIE